MEFANYIDDPTIRDDGTRIYSCDERAAAFTARFLEEIAVDLGALHWVCKEICVQSDQDEPLPPSGTTSRIVARLEQYGQRDIEYMTLLAFNSMFNGTPFSDTPDFKMTDPLPQHVIAAIAVLTDGEYENLEVIHPSLGARPWNLITRDRNLFRAIWRIRGCPAE